MKEWCKNGMQHSDGKRKFAVLTDGLCSECFDALNPKSNKEAEAETCRLTRNDRPKNVHIDKALSLFCEPGKTKPKKTRTTLDKKRYQARKEKLEREKLELAQYKKRCGELEKELEKARQQILALQYKLQQHLVAI